MSRDIMYDFIQSSYGLRLMGGGTAVYPRFEPSFLKRLDRE